MTDQLLHATGANSTAPTREEGAMIVWRWRQTKFGPLNESLQGRFGQPVRVFARGLDGKVGVEFEDGYRVIAPFYSAGKAR
jgi:hypothetical protein